MEATLDKWADAANALYSWGYRVEHRDGWAESNRLLSLLAAIEPDVGPFDFFAINSMHARTHWLNDSLEWLPMDEFKSRRKI